MSDMKSFSVESYLVEVAARKSTPGGGAVAAISAAQACALIAMVARFSEGLNVLVETAERDIKDLLALAEADATAFKSVMKAYKDKSNIEDALQSAAQVPLELITICENQIDALEQLTEDGNKNLITDVGIAAALLQSAIYASELNVRINANGMSSTNKTSMLSQLESTDALKRQLSDIQQRINSSLQEA